MGLSNRQKLFKKFYIKSRNATKAYIEAGYSEKTANKAGPALLVKLGKEIDDEIQKMATKIDVEIEEIVRELRLIGFSDIKDFIEFEEGSGIRIKSLDEIPEHATRAIESIQEDRVIRESSDGSQTVVHDKIKFKLHSKIKALELLAKYKNMLSDRVELTGKDGGPIQTSAMSNDEAAVLYQKVRDEQKG